jgi:hypothetical protein
MDFITQSNAKRLPKQNELIQLRNEKGTPKFDFEQFPVGYFAENEKGKALRKQLIVNSIKVSDCDLGALEKVFFSKENIDLINKQLILEIYKRSNKTFLICAQKEEKLIIVMRYVYLEYARHLPYNIKEQIKELNCIVVGEILPTVLSNADSQIGYMRDITTQPIGPPLPINTKNLERTLPSISNLLLGTNINPQRLKYDDIVEKEIETNIQGFPGLQGFIY